MDLYEQFKQAYADKGFTGQGRPVLLAVSGGLDSMVLAHLCQRAAIQVAVGHCNFRLRGDASERDEAFVRAWCDTHGIPFFVTHFDTKKLAITTGKGIQELARDLRYEWLKEIQTVQGFEAIATAHHADDNAETLLMNLCRGTGIAGLHGIRERNGSIIRPLLFATRAAILQYAQEHNIQYREDASNSTDDYLRNALRHHVLPVLEQRMPGASLRMLETSRHIGETEILYQQSIAQHRKKLVQQRGPDDYIPVRLLMHRQPLETICYELFKPYGFAAAQIPFILDILKAGSGKYISSATHRIIRNRDFLIVTKLQAAATDLLLIESVPATIDGADHQFQFSGITKVAALDAGEAVAHLDMEQLEWPLILRRWRTGDYFYPLGMGMKKKKVGRFLIDQKVPLHEKEHIWVLESAKRIVWIAGMRIDERFKIKPGTTQILKVTMH